ncbi:MAG TPA: class I SAM-dependent methyltransferase [Clostridiales bacterium]|nr:class I SAM-dependent methyltransferase [Clostridiales bacterium]HQP70486.1 class I SAM-dependent methyltransferase [Clostridiales bacterium]
MMQSGIVKIENYKKVLESESFSELESYSDNFTKLQRELFPEFSKRWVKDSFHQWSRQYEYPFVADAISDLSAGAGRILDAGSGITFFPYYLKEKYADIQIECCDYDPKLKEQFERVNSKLDKNIQYFNADIRNIEKPDKFYDMIYCISVLEHTDDYDGILKELARITSKDGHLILTFDISMDGSADISIEKAIELLAVIEKYYIQVTGKVSLSGSDLKNSDLLTTNYINTINKKLLPWRYPYLMFFKSLSKGKLSKYLLRNLTCYCGVFKKKPEA